ncbi:1-deoxy-D-xylulose-5-phosphate synthase [Geosporobacter subterraneus DSM 17957]|uniref:1-deoxy-D-xylulose-5-phosphate synthase n=1 Tax=Geosporobacter subterraneus DSM 17957 TaxID=1121919 RepID=A0A1M6C437_9FIRM|nr:1-deoxy-D-xylulose-5-phosphate synthase [Geosporobacter subterraneus]SHI55796.1 1-deoxy-D-xylulose-5-phosphate synthase [Geosporobacter subterraneus DSM 17957]
MNPLTSYLSSISSVSDVKKLSDQELHLLADEIRSFLIEHISKTGGHLASNLGVVEMTLALHSVFDSPKDKMIWDVGHQAYVHKILTGRKHLFHTLRKYKGLSGFPKRSESEHDIIDTGHSSTSISAGYGMACARDLQGGDYSVISIIGDGALTGGMAFEALNHAGHSNTNFIVILNDNEMSISQNVGGLSSYLNRLRTDPAYFKMKVDVESLLTKIPAIGKAVFKTAEKAKDSIKYFLVPGILFEELGFTYLGPVDGHTIKELKMVFKRAKNIKGPVLIHVLTKKGKGYSYAEENPDKFHGISPFDIETGSVVPSGSGRPSYSAVFGKSLVDLAKNDPSIVAITAAMPSGTGLNEFAKTYPRRFFDVGIAEQHAVTFAAGLALNGMRPFFPVYSTFLQRAYDQIVHDICLQNLPVVFCIDRSGLVGNDGETHHGVFDISFLSHIPNMTLLAPKDGKEFERMLSFAAAYQGPIAIRYPRGESDNFATITVDPEVNPLKAEILTEGNDLCIIAIGNMVRTAYDAAEALRSQDIHCKVVNARAIKPLDQETLLQACEGIEHIITLEDHVVTGGFGSLVLNLFNRKQDIKEKQIRNLGLPEAFIEHGDVEELMEQYGLNVEGLISCIRKLLGK